MQPKPNKSELTHRLGVAFNALNNSVSMTMRAKLPNPDLTEPSKLIAFLLLDPKIEYFMESIDWQEYTAVNLANSYRELSPRIQADPRKISHTQKVFIHWQLKRLDDREKLIYPFLDAMGLSDLDLHNKSRNELINDLIVEPSELNPVLTLIENDVAALIYYCYISNELAEHILAIPSINQNAKEAVRKFLEIDHCLDQQFALLSPGELSDQERKILLAAALEVVNSKNPSKVETLSKDAAAVLIELKPIAGAVTEALQDPLYEGHYRLARLKNVTKMIVEETHAKEILSNNNNLTSDIVDILSAHSISSATATIAKIDAHLKIENIEEQHQKSLHALKKQLENDKAKLAGLQKANLAGETLNLRVICEQILADPQVDIPQLGSLTELELACATGDPQDLQDALKNAGKDWQKPRTNVTLGKSFADRVLEIFHRIDLSNFESVKNAATELENIHYTEALAIISNTATQLKTHQKQLIGSLSTEEPPIFDNENDTFNLLVVYWGFLSSIRNQAALESKNEFDHLADIHLALQEAKIGIDIYKEIAELGLRIDENDLYHDYQNDYEDRKSDLQQFSERVDRSKNVEGIDSFLAKTIAIGQEKLESIHAKMSELNPPPRPGAK